jgi:hypothetical protein
VVYFLQVALVCALSASTLFCNTFTDNALLDRETQYDLDLVASEKSTLSMFFDNTITKRGNRELNHFLLNPTDNRDILHKRQRHLCFLLERSELSALLQNELQDLAAYEPLPKEQVNDHLGEKSLERVYFSWSRLKHLNTNPYALDIAYGMHIASMCAPLAEHIILHLGIDLLANATHGDHHDHDHHDHHHHHHGCSHAHHHHDSGSSDMTYYGLQALHWGLHLPSLYDMACDIQDRALMIKYVQAQTIRIATYVRHAEHMYALLKESGALPHRFEPYAQLQYFFGDAPACSPSFSKLLNLLKTSTFQGEASVFSHVGNVLAAYKLYSNVQDEFEKLSKAIGEIDVYLSAASFMQKQTSMEPWCFVQFSSDEKPKLVIENVRHLFIANCEALDFSSEKSLHRLVMGDNGSGKSTYLMRVGHAVVLAQTFGIAPATRCEMTPFAHIFTFRFIHDNMVEGTSRFYAECARVAKIVDAISNDKKRACIILDEPFAHTGAEKGASYLQKSLADIGVLDNAISLIATHYHDLKAAHEEMWDVEHLPANVYAKAAF